METHSRIYFVSGGARSGKSAFAEDLAAKLGGDKVGYIATSIPFDEGMRDRVKKHVDRRPSAWTTFEEAYTPSQAILAHGASQEVYLLDCLTILSTNHMLKDNHDWDLVQRDLVDQIEADLCKEIDAIVEAVHKTKTRLIFVTNELGLGVVPENRMARLFRDIAGIVNQKAAAHTDEAWMVVSGLPLKIKG